MEIAPELEKQTDEKEKEKIIGSAIATHFAGEKSRAELDKAFSAVFGLEHLLSFADAFASSLVRDAISLRRRQLAATGMSEDDYEAMLYALGRLNLCESIIRIAYPSNGLQFELSLASQGEFKATGIMEGASVVEWARLKAPLAALKRGQDNALALFIAHYINKHHVGPRRAFACAQYGDQSKPELDVVVPDLNLGFEVKLYQAPFAQTDNKLEKLANDLKRQLPAYSNAGCERLFYVSNLSQNMAESVLKRVEAEGGAGMDIQVVAEGMGSLLPALNDIGQGLDYVQQESLDKQVQTRIAAATQKKSGSE